MPDTFADLDLRALADLEGPERAFLTLYLDRPEALDGLTPRLKVLGHLLAEAPAELEHFEQNLKLAEGLVEGLEGGDGGWLVLCCWALDLARVFPLGVDVTPGAWVGAVPHLRPLAELQDEFEDFAVAIADASAARIFRVHAQQAEGEGRVRGDVKNRVKKGGWSQKRYARRRDKQLEQYASEVAGALAELDRERPFNRLVLLGQDEARQAIEAALPRPLREKVVGEQSVDTDDEAGALEAAYALYFEGERAEEAALWNDIREGYLTGGLAVVGAQRTLAAAQAARAETALIARDVALSATRCRACEHVVYGTPDTCQRCGSRDVFETDYVNELVDALTRTGADADFTDNFDALSDVGHVGALLRY